MRSRRAAVAAAGVAALLALAPAAPAVARQAPPADLLTPAALTGTAPASYRVMLDMSVGRAVVQVHRDWAPHAADRFYALVRHHFYDGCRFFRVVPNFVAQFGIHPDPAVSAAWAHATLPVERARQSNTRGRVSFAMASPETRTTQVFINLGDNSKLDPDGFAPFGEVVTSMIIVDFVFSGYGEGPDQARIQAEGNAYLLRELPALDYIRTAAIIAP